MLPFRSVSTSGRPETRARATALRWEIGVGLVVTIGAMALAHAYDLFERFAVLSRRYESVELDEFFVLLVVASGMLAVVAIRRARAQHAAERARDTVDVESAGVFRAMRDVVLVLRRDGQYLKVPATNADGLYRPAADLVGRHVHDVLPAPEADAVCAVIRQSLDSGAAATMEYTLYFGEREICFSALVTPLDEHSVVWVARDVTAEVHARRALRESEAEYRELQHLHLQSQKLEAIGSLASGIAHEINTPLQYVGDNARFLGEGIAAFAAVLHASRAVAAAAKSHVDVDGSVDAYERAAFHADADYPLVDLARAATHVREGCDQMAGIVNAMKEFSRPRDSRKHLADINAAVRDTVAVCRNKWKYVATLTTDLDDDMPFVRCLPGELRLVMLNLIVNAADAVTEARSGRGTLGSIAVSTRRDGDWAEIRVQDDGLGIPVAIHGRVFDPFFSTKQSEGSTGQGLSIAHATIVRQHHGTLTFESAAGIGTTFLIRLPLDGDVDTREAA